MSASTQSAPPGAVGTRPRSVGRWAVAAVALAAAAVLASVNVHASARSVEGNQSDGEDPFFLGLLFLPWVGLAVAGLAFPVLWAFPDRVRALRWAVGWWALLTALGLASYVHLLADGFGRDSQADGDLRTAVIVPAVIGVLVATCAAGLLPRRRRVVGWATSIGLLTVTWLAFAFAALPRA